MGTLIVTTFVSLDGVMQGPGGPEEDTSGGFDHGGWTVPHFDDSLGVEVVRTHLEADAFLMGRRTYDVLGSHWPRIGSDDPLAAKLNGAPKYLASRSRAAGDWAPTTVIADAGPGVAALKGTLDGSILVIGSSDLLRTLIGDGLVDEYRLWVFPVVLGRGKRLFADGSPPSGLELVRSATGESGVMMQVYRPTGAPATGSFALDG